MVLHETEQQLQSVLDGTVLAACRQTLALLYQTELAVEGSINVILDKSETIHVKINNCEVKSKEDLDEKKIEKIKVTSPPKRRRGRPPKSQSKTKVNLIEEKVKKTEPLPSCSNEEIGEAAVSDRGTPVKKEPSEKAAIPQAAKSDPQSFKDMVVNSSLSELQHLATQLAHHVPPDDVQDTDADDRKKDEGASNISGAMSVSDSQDVQRSSSHKTVTERKNRKKIKVETHVCSICGKMFTKPWLLRNHLKSHSDHRPFKCNHCNKTFKTQFHAQECENVHTGAKLYKCKHCDRVFKRYTNYKAHEKIHTDHEYKNKFKCQFCEYTTYKKDTLRIHERKHTGEKPFKCSYCDYRSSRKANVQTHEIIHTGNKPFKCKYCPQMFPYVTSRNHHEKIHEGKPDFQCKFCGKFFFRKIHMEIHERTHTGEKPYSCEYCGKCFSDHRNLTPHQRTHTGEKPHKCSICDAGFDRKRSLNNHMKSHQRENSANERGTTETPKTKSERQSRGSSVTAPQPYQTGVIENQNEDDSSSVQQHVGAYVDVKPQGVSCGAVPPDSNSYHLVPIITSYSITSITPLPGNTK